MKTNGDHPAFFENRGGQEHLDWQRVICSALLVLITIGIYFHTRKFEFINYDDNADVYDNPIVKQGLTWEGIKTAFSVSQSNNWVPLTMLSHMLDCQLFGLNAGGHHLTNVLLHTISAVLLFLLLNKMTGALWPSYFAALIFAIHPLHIQSVAWIAERKDVLSGLFFMLTLWFYVDYARERTNKSGHLTVFGIFVLGLMAKPMLMTMPLVLLLVDYWPLKRWPQVSASRLLLEKAPFLLTSLLCGLVAMLAQGEAITPSDNIPLVIKLGNVLISYAAYIFQTIIPAHLSIFYPYPENTLSATQLVASFIFLSLVTLR
jgi:protein O-mannosyl-transferase